jgi:hypothetical protein
VKVDALRQIGPARRLRDDGEGGRREPAQILLRLLVVDVDELAELPLTAQRCEGRLEVGDIAARATLEVDVLVRQAGMERLVHEQPPHLLERHVAHQILDVDAAIAKLAALLVGLRDVRLERDHSGEPGRKVVAAHA